MLMLQGIAKRAHDFSIPVIVLTLLFSLLCLTESALCTGGMPRYFDVIQLVQTGWLLVRNGMDLDVLCLSISQFGLGFVFSTDCWFWHLTVHSEHDFIHRQATCSML